MRVTERVGVRVRVTERVSIRVRVCECVCASACVRKREGESINNGFEFATRG